jgi:hypothetical protein
MKVSAFTFIRNAEQLGFPFIQSIRSVLPIVDEFIINVGVGTDSTLAKVKALNESKIKIIETPWNDAMQEKGFVYAQQKMIAQYSCTGDWAFYLEADEILHEKDYPSILHAMKTHCHDDRVEALVFDYLHFYGNINTYLWSPAWYRRAARIIKTSVRNYAPDGLFWVVLDKKNKIGRYPNAALANATIYHYGWVRSETQMRQKMNQVSHYWSQQPDDINVHYAAIDQASLHKFKGEHPNVVDGFFPTEEGVYQADPNHVLTKRERKNRFGLTLEKYFGLELSRKHYQLLKV